MGVFDFDFSDEFMNQLEELGNVDVYAPQMVDAALPVLQRALQGAYSKHRITAALAGSVKIKKATENAYGYFGVVFPSGTDARGVRNAEKAVYLEYGTSKQHATPVIASAVNSCEGEVLKVMEEVFNEVVGE